MGRRIRRWLLAMGVVAAVAAGFAMDLRLKTAGGAPGYVPADARWVAYAPRLDRLWDYATCSGAFGAAPEAVLADNPACRFLKEWPRPYGAMELAIRKSTGIRPTPARWGLWMGKGLLAFGTGDGVGFCTRPGLLLRAAHFFNRNAENEIFRYGPYAYAWRDGCCIFSTSPKVVAAALSAPAYAPDALPEQEEVRIDWHAWPETVAFVRPEQGWAIRGRMRMTVAPSAGPLTLAEAWPEGVLLDAAASDGRAVAVVANWLRQAAGTLPEWMALDAAVPPWAAEVAGDRACAAALLATGEQQAPSLAWALRLPVLTPEEPHPMSATTAAPSPPALARTGETWLAASDPGMLPALETQPVAGAGAKAEAVLRVDWTRTGKVLEQYLRARADKDESLVPPVETNGAPAARALAQLGALRIEGHAQGDALVFKGRLASRSATPAAP